MSHVFSEETHRNLLARIPHCTGREVSDWLRTVEEGPALFRFEEKVSWLRHEYDLAYGHAKAIAYDRLIDDPCLWVTAVPWKFNKASAEWMQRAQACQ